MYLKNKICLQTNKMKYLKIISTILIVILSSCIQDSKKDSPILQDSITIVKKSERIIDPIDEKRPYGSLVFGMSSKDVDRASGFKYQDTIGWYSYSFNPDYHNDSLYMLEISGPNRSAEDYESEIRDHFNTLRSTITEQYGSAEIDKGLPAFWDIKKGTFETGLEWKLGDKRILLGIRKYEYSYYVLCRIYSQKMMDAVWEAEWKERAEKEKKEVNKF